MLFINVRLNGILLPDHEQHSKDPMIKFGKTDDENDFSFICILLNNAKKDNGIIDTMTTK